MAIAPYHQKRRSRRLSTHQRESELVRNAVERSGLHMAVGRLVRAGRRRSNSGRWPACAPPSEPSRKTRISPCSSFPSQSRPKSAEFAYLAPRERNVSADVNGGDAVAVAGGASVRTHTCVWCAHGPSRWHTLDHPSSCRLRLRAISLFRFSIRAELRDAYFVRVLRAKRSMRTRKEV
jgi:hypothetical protein